MVAYNRGQASTRLAPSCGKCQVKTWPRLWFPTVAYNRGQAFTRLVPGETTGQVKTW